MPGQSDFFKVTDGETKDNFAGCLAMLKCDLHEQNLFKLIANIAGVTVSNLPSKSYLDICDVVVTSLRPHIDLGHFDQSTTAKMTELNMKLQAFYFAGGDEPELNCFITRGQARQIAEKQLSLSATDLQKMSKDALMLAFIKKMIPFAGPMQSLAAQLLLICKQTQTGFLKLSTLTAVYNYIELNPRSLSLQQKKDLLQFISCVLAKNNHYLCQSIEYILLNRQYLNDNLNPNEVKLSKNRVDSFMLRMLPKLLKIVDDLQAIFGREQFLPQFVLIGAQFIKMQAAYLDFQQKLLNNGVIMGDYNDINILKCAALTLLQKENELDTQLALKEFVAGQVSYRDELYIPLFSLSNNQFSLGEQLLLVGKLFEQVRKPSSCCLM